MLTKKMFAVLLAGLLISSAFIIDAQQDNSVEQMMKNDQKRNQVMDYM